MERRTPWLGYLCVILSAVVFGCMPLGANFLYAQGVTPMSLVFLRNLLSLPVLSLLCQKQGGLRISRGALLETSLTGFFGCCITPILLFSSYRYLASGMATVFHFAYPVIVVLGGLVLRERVQKKALFCAVLCSLGILLLIDPSGAVDPLGVALALTSGVTYAVYILLLAHFRHREVTGFRMTFYMALISAVCMFFLCLFSHQLCLPQTLAGWLAALAFSLMICIGAVVLFQKGTFLIGAQRAAILSTFEPITSMKRSRRAFCSARRSHCSRACSSPWAAKKMKPKKRRPRTELFYSDSLSPLFPHARRATIIARLSPSCVKMAASSATSSSLFSCAMAAAAALTAAGSAS